MTERELERRAQRRLAVLRHVEEVSFNAAAPSTALWPMPAIRRASTSAVIEIDLLPSSLARC